MMKKLCMACLLVGAALAATADAYRTHLKGSLIRERLDAPAARQLKALGLDGVEMNLMNLKELPTVDEAREVHAVAEREGLTICSVISGWFAFNEKDRYDAELAKAKRCVELTAAYGAPIMLLVPVGFYPENGPKPPPYRDVAYSWDPVTLAVSAVVKGDNAPYAEFIRRQNEATAAAVRAVRELIPLAAEKGVIIALENVGSRMWMKPDFHHALVRSFNSPWVKFYFDLGNSLNVGDPCEWIDEFGADIVKVHLKDDVLDATRPWGQRQVAIGSGEIDFKSLRDGLERINYNGWVTVESDFGTGAEHAAALKRFITGADLLGRPMACECPCRNRGERDPVICTEQERAEGFVPLYNGKDLSGWQLQGTEGCYRVGKDGVLEFDRDAGSGNLWTVRDYTNFTVRFEFKLSADCNNGLAVRSPYGPGAAYNGMEIQMLDDEGYMYTTTFPQLGLYQKACGLHGSVYGVIPSKHRPDGRSYLNPVGTWNKQEVTLDGSKVKVTLNGTVILDDDLSRYPTDGTTMDGEKHPGLRNASGRLGWLSHGYPCWWRRIRIKELK